MLPDGQRAERDARLASTGTAVLVLTRS